MRKNYECDTDRLVRVRGILVFVKCGILYHFDVTVIYS